MNNQGIKIHFPEREIDFSFPKCPDWLRGPQISYSCVLAALTVGVKQMKNEADQTPQSRMHGGACMSTSPYVSTVHTRITFVG